MSDLNLTHWAIRAGVNGVLSDMSSPADGQAEKIKALAESRAQGMMSSMASQPDIDQELKLVGLALVGISAAYMAVQAIKSSADDKRLAYIKERDAETASFVVPMKKERRDLTSEEHFFKSFIEFTRKKIPYSYAGVHESSLGGELGTFYPVLPFYSMGKMLGYPVANRTQLDQQRRAVSLFLNVGVPRYLTKIDKYLQKEWKVTSFFKSLGHGHNYLNDLRATRCLVMMLANILWNLQHPIDPATGYPLATPDAIKQCKSVCLYLESLLATAIHPTEEKKAQPPFFYKLCHNKPWLVSYVRKIHIYVESLRVAYVHEQLHEINVDDITNSAHQILESLDRGLLSLIYKRNDPWTDEPNDSAANDLADTMSYLQDLFMRNPDLINYFSVYKWPEMQKAMVNDPPVTVLDAVIIFCHINKRARENLINTLRNKSHESEIELADCLEHFNESFIRPVERKSKQVLGLKSSRLRSEAESNCMAIYAAKRFIPYLTLLLSDFEINIDTPAMLDKVRATGSSPESDDDEVILTGAQQIKQINMLASGLKTKPETDEYYQRTLLLFIKNEKLKENIDELLDCQTRISSVVRVMDALKFGIDSYRQLLQKPAFQQAFLMTLTAIKEEYSQLKHKLSIVDNAIFQTEGTALELKETLTKLDEEMTGQLASLNGAIANVKSVVSSPMFVLRERKKEVRLLRSLDKQIKDLWDKDSGLQPLIDELDKGGSTAAPESQPRLVLKSAPGMKENYIDGHKMVALSHLAHQCFAKMSYLSQWGHKGTLLKNLIRLIDNQTNFTEDQLTSALKELVKIVASYRTTYFFQASYGQTSSAKYLIQKIKDPLFSLTLGERCFGKSAKKSYASMSDHELFRCFRGLRKEARWHEASEAISMTKKF